jgi:methylmalonyl-CoA mutase cobalamin-binding subunit
VSDLFGAAPTQRGRVLVAAVPGSDQGLGAVARTLRDEGFEVVQAPPSESLAAVWATAVDEDVERVVLVGDVAATEVTRLHESLAAAGCDAVVDVLGVSSSASGDATCS